MLPKWVWINFIPQSCNTFLTSTTRGTSLKNNESIRQHKTQSGSLQKHCSATTWSLRSLKSTKKNSRRYLSNTRWKRMVTKLKFHLPEWKKYGFSFHLPSELSWWRLVPQSSHAPLVCRMTLTAFKSSTSTCTYTKNSLQNWQRKARSLVMKSKGKVSSELIRLTYAKKFKRWSKRQTAAISSLLSNLKTKILVKLVILMTYISFLLISFHKSTSFSRWNRVSYCLTCSHFPLCQWWTNLKLILSKLKCAHPKDQGRFFQLKRLQFLKLALHSNP